MARQELVTLSQEVCSRLPLNEAVSHYAPASLKKEARRVAKLEYREPTLPDLKDVSVLSIGLVFLAAIGGMGGQWSERLKPWSDMRAELRRRLYERELEAFGIMAAPELCHDPEKISAAIFYKPEFDWAENAVTSSGYKFVSVKVGLPFSGSVIELQPRETKTAERRPGRPSKAEEIRDAINGLLGNKIDLNAMPRQQAFEAVREHAHKHLNANIGIGYSDETIQRELLQIVGKRR